MLRILFFGLFIWLFGCNNIEDVIHVEAKKTTLVEKKQTCEVNLEEKLRTFYGPITNDFRDDVRDTKILNEIKDCPREEIVKSLVELQKSKKNDIEIQAKTAYLLIKLNHNRAENGKNLISTYSAKLKDYLKKSERAEIKDDFDLDRLMDLICRIISEENEKQEFLTDAFDLVLLSDGAMSETLSGTLSSQFEKTPELFLQKLKPKSNKIKQQTYAFLFYSIPKDKVLQQDKVLQHLTPINKDSEVYSLVEEIQKFAKNRKTEN